MPRQASIDALWGQMLSGNSPARNKQLVQQYGNQLPVTPEVIASVTQGMGPAGRQSYLDTLLGGTGNPFDMPPGVTSPEDFGYIEINGEVKQDKPPRAVAEQQRLMELAQQQQMGEQQMAALGRIAGGTGPDAQTARQILGVPTSPDFRNIITPEQDQVLRSRMTQESAARSQIEQYASQPFATEANVQDLWNQHSAAFPEFAGGQRPKTRDEQVQEMRVQKLATYQQQMPDVPLDYNEKGEIEVIPGYAEARRVEYDAQRNAMQARENNYSREIELLRDREPERPEKGAPPEAVAEYDRQREHLRNMRQAVYDNYFGKRASQSQAPPAPEPPEKGSQLPVNRKQMEMYQQQATAAGLPLAVDDRDFSDLEPGQQFVDAADGQVYQK